MASTGDVAHVPSECNIVPYCIVSSSSVIEHHRFCLTVPKELWQRSINVFLDVAPESRGLRTGDRGGHPISPPRNVVSRKDVTLQ